MNGTTAENPTLTKEERYEILDFVLEKNAGRLPVVFGIGGNNTMAVAQEMSAFNVEGVSALLSGAHTTISLLKKGIYQHYKALSEASELPIILHTMFRQNELQYQCRNYASPCQ